MGFIKWLLVSAGNTVDYKIRWNAPNVLTPMKQIESRQELKEYYFDKNRVDSYIEERFKRPLGRILHEAQVEMVNETINTYQARHVMELAPGPGRVTVEVAGFDTGVMVDSSENMLALAKQRLEQRDNHEQWSFVQADLFDYTTQTPCDLVFTFRFIRHLDEEKRVKMYAKIREFLKEKGLLIFDAVNSHVSLPLRQKHPEEYPVYDVLYTRQELISELQKNGFDVVTLRSVQCHYGVQTFLNNYLTKFNSDALVYRMIALLEKKNAPNPLEWIVLCQKK